MCLKENKSDYVNFKQFVIVKYCLGDIGSKAL